MKRDMDLIRAIAFRVEDAKAPFLSTDLAIEAFTPEQIGYHAQLMLEGQLIHATPTGDMDVPELFIGRLTWDGHDFLDAARSDTIWGKAKSAVKTGASSVAFDVLKGLLKTLAGQAVEAATAATGLLTG